MTSIILASSSQIRQTILKNAGINFSIKSPQIDERIAVENAGGEEAFSPPEMAQYLADQKALDVSKRNPNAFVVGADQVLGFAGSILHKAKTLADASQRIQTLSGKTHHLYAGVSLCQNGIVIWRHVATSSLTMRELSEQEIGFYIDQAGADILSSVGCYQLEGLGSKLFEAIEGDFFSILGLPLLPLLNALRENGVEL